MTSSVCADLPVLPARCREATGRQGSVAEVGRLTGGILVLLGAHSSTSRIGHLSGMTTTPGRDPFRFARLLTFTINILDLNAHHGDASAALVTNDGIVAAVAEERVTRIKHWAGLPTAGNRVLPGAAPQQGEEGGDEIRVAVFRQPRAYLARKAALALAHPRSLGRALRRVKNLSAINRLDERLEEVGGDSSPPPRSIPSSTIWPTWPRPSSVHRGKRRCASPSMALATSSRR